MILPARAPAFMLRAAAWHVRNTPRMLVSITRSHSSTVTILLADPNPRQFLPPPRQLVAAPRELLLRLEQLEPRCEPLFTCPGHVLRHRSVPLSFGMQPSVFGPETLSRSRLLSAAL